MSSAAELYTRMQVPDAALLDRRMAKKLFVENGELSAADKKTLLENVEQILWKYTFKPTTVAIASYSDEEREYTEVALLEVTVRSRKGVDRLAQLIHRTVPYPILLVLTDHSGAAVSVAEKRLSKAEAGAWVATEFAMTPWSSDPPSELDRAFFDSLHFRSLNQQDFLAFYGDVHARVVARSCGDTTGRFQLDGSSPVEREGRRKQAQQLQREIDRARAELRGAPSIARSVELNVEIQDLKRRLARELETL